jgi:CRISPR-associated endoribonuclease Cas6
MRIYLRTSPIAQTLPFNYQPILTGVLHKWLGANELHDGLSLYSFSWLEGGQVLSKGLRFREGASWFISSHDPAMIRALVAAIQQDPEMMPGTYVRSLALRDTPAFGAEAYCLLGSPVLIKQQQENGIRHLTFEDEEAPAQLAEILRRKARAAGIAHPDIEIHFDRTYAQARTKVIYYRNIGNRVSLCPLILRGNPDMIALAWDAGVGHSTGIGFGSLK